MAKIGASFKRGTKTQIENTSVVDGQVLWETDQGGSNKIYNDVGTTRVQIGGDTDVVDVLDSTSIYDALSANKGRELDLKSEQVYTQSGITLTGYGIKGRFKATSSATVTSFTIGSTSYDVKVGEDSEIELVVDCWYSFILDEVDSTINFKSGGASLNYKIIASTTQPSSPKENTIWVNTATPINEYAFSSENPWNKMQYLDTGTITAKKYLNSNGAITTNNAWNLTNYIKVPTGASSVYFRENTYATIAYHAWYTANKTLISTFQSENTTVTITPPSNAKYLRCSIHDDDLGDVDTWACFAFIEKFTPQNGDLWICTQNIFDENINLFKKNYLLDTVCYAVQYVNGEFVNKPLKLYSNDEWRAENKWWIFKDGVSYVAFNWWRQYIGGGNNRFTVLNNGNYYYELGGSTNSANKIEIKSIAPVDLQGAEEIHTVWVSGTKLDMTVAGVDATVSGSIQSVDVSDVDTLEFINFNGNVSKENTISGEISEIYLVY